MTRLSVTQLCALLVLTLATEQGQVLSQAPLHLQAKSGLVLVETPDGVGSGFAVSPSLVSTACHVVKGAAAIKLHFWAAKVEVAARKQLCDEKQDVAYLSVAVPQSTAILEFATESPLQGEQIWVWGYPLGTAIALEPSVAVGIVSATETAQGFLALNVSGAPGNSGGPVVNAQGKVVGIYVASWVAEGQGETGFKYAVPASVAAKLLPTGVAPAPPASPTVASSPITIRPGDSLGAVKIGMTPAQAQDAIGLPPSDHEGPWYTWETRRLTVRVDDGKVELIGTRDPADVTAEGIRVGSTDTDLIKAYGTPVCATILSFRGKASLGWVYEGLIVFLEGFPRRAVYLVVSQRGSARQVCS